MLGAPPTKKTRGGWNPSTEGGCSERSTRKREDNNCFAWTADLGIQIKSRNRIPSAFREGPGPESVPSISHGLVLSAGRNCVLFTVGCESDRWINFSCKLEFALIFIRPAVLRPVLISRRGSPGTGSKVAQSVGRELADDAMGNWKRTVNLLVKSNCTMKPNRNVSPKPPEKYSSNFKYTTHVLISVPIYSTFPIFLKPLEVFLWAHFFQFIDTALLVLSTTNSKSLLVIT